jgi:outer membrane immunogenic protein
MKKCFATVGLLGAVSLIALGWAFPAFPADLQLKANQRSTFTPVYDPWNGVYGGVNIGYGWDTSAFPLNATFSDLVAGSQLAAAPQGFVGGLQAGYGLHNGPFYLGIEGDIQGAAIKGTASMPGNLLATSVSGNMDWFATARLRAGIVVGPALFYATGGGAYGNVKDSFSVTSGGTMAAEASTTKGGWALGAGLEVALAQEWTAKLEYLRVDLGTVSATSVQPGAVITLSPTFQADVVRAGINYHF